MNESDILLIKNIINKWIDPLKTKVFIFGSRVDGTARKFSDYDIGFEGEKLSPTTYFDLKQDFEDSDFPYTVDIVDFTNASEKFKDIAKKKIIPINY